MLFIFNRFPILDTWINSVSDSSGFAQCTPAHKGRRPLKSHPTPRIDHPSAWPLPSILLTMCRMRIQAECRTSDVTTYQKWKSTVHRGLGR